nr:immunoglobulin heavy chain junction region [Mus musculus]
CATYYSNYLYYYAMDYW